MQSDDMDVEELAMALIDTERCGISPCEFKVLVLPDESDVIASFRRAGLATPDEVNERYRAASMTGRVVSMSPAAFSYHDWPDHVRLPEVGDRVVFARYAGINIKGQHFTNAKGHKERLEYRLINDKDIAAILHFPD
nr:hypothetical protein [uncultured archaeon]